MSTQNPPPSPGALRAAEKFRHSFVSLSDKSTAELVELIDAETRADKAEILDALELAAGIVYGGALDGVVYTHNGRAGH